MILFCRRNMIRSLIDRGGDKHGLTRPTPDTWFESDADFVNPVRQTQRNAMTDNEAQVELASEMLTQNFQVPGMRKRADRTGKISN
jgi:hypothetical protein